MAMRQRKQNELVRREKDILASAMLLFGGENWPSVTMDQIAASADVSKGTLYNHFASKDDIYARLLIDFSLDVLSKLEQLDSEVAPEARVRAILAVFWDGYRENRHFLRIAYNCEREGFRQSLSARHQEELEALDQRFLAVTSAAIKHGVDKRVFRKAPMARLLMGPQLLLAGMSRFLWTSEAAPAVKDPRFAAVSEFVLAGLRRHDN